MRKVAIILMLFLTSHAVNSQVFLEIDANQYIMSFTIEHIVDDIYYEVVPLKIENNLAFLKLQEYQDYMIVINGTKYITLSTGSYELRDDRDLSISADVDYKFEKGILKFNY